MSYYNRCRYFLARAYSVYAKNVYSCHTNNSKYISNIYLKSSWSFQANVKNFNQSVLSKSVVIKNVIKSIGITDEKTNSLLKHNRDLLSCSPKKLEQMMKTLSLWGFNPDDIKLLLEDATYVFNTSPGDVENILNFLNEKVTSAHAIKSVMNTPELLLLKLDYLKSRTKQLLSVFSNADLKDLFEYMPLAFFEDWDDIMKKLRYILHEMELEQKEILSAHALGYRLEHIRARHRFLCLSGNYVVPKKRNIDSKCPSLRKIISGRDIDFVKICGLSLEEYKVFFKLSKMEYEEAGSNDDEEGTGDHIEEEIK